MLSQPENWLQQTRTFRVLRQLLPAWRIPRPVEDMNRAPVRVMAEQYRDNLEKIVSDAEAHDCRVMLVTAPTAFEEQAMPGWAYGFFNNFYKMSKEQVDAIPAVHDEYCDIVREIADGREDVMLIDAHRLWAIENVAGRFRRDRIHLTELGHADLAEMIFKAWRHNIGSQPRENQTDVTSDKSG